MNTTENFLWALLLFIASFILGAVATNNIQNIEKFKVDTLARYEICIKGGGLEQYHNCVLALLAPKATI